jgi:hypothetical protein
MKSINLDRKEIHIILEEFENSRRCTGDEGTSELKGIIKKFHRALTPIKIASRKGKGRELQKWVCERISELIRIPYNQQDDACLIHSREMGQAGCDIILRGEALKKFPFAIECKSSESLSLTEAIQQAQANQGKIWTWLVIHKRKAFKEPIVIMEWQTFEDLFKG